MFLHVSVILLTGEGVSGQGEPPRAGRTPPGPGRPPRTRQTPPDQADTPPNQADTPQTRENPPNQADTPLDHGDHPPGPGRHPGTRQTPPPDQADTPPGNRLTPPGSSLQDTVYERPVRILLECILVFMFMLVVRIYQITPRPPAKMFSFSYILLRKVTN